MLVKKKKMHSKGAKKSFKNNYDVIKSRKYAQESEGALNPNYYVKAQMRTGNWYLGKIIECRPNQNSLANPDHKRNDHSYDYYIHYEDFDRRMDEWVPRGKINPTNQFIDEGAPNKDKKNKDEDDEHEGLDKQSRLYHEEATKVKTISSIKFGPHTSETWYYSPYPEPYHNIDCLYICEYCLSFYISEQELKNHELKCELTHPPGNEIYRDNAMNLCVFEVDGYKNPVYCEN